MHVGPHVGPRSNQCSRIQANNVAGLFANKGGATQIGGNRDYILIAIQLGANFLTNTP